MKNYHIQRGPWHLRWTFRKLMIQFLGEILKGFGQQEKLVNFFFFFEQKKLVDWIMLFVNWIMLFDVSIFD